jgi:hypothetical protein
MGDNTSVISFAQDQQRAIKYQANQRPNEKKKTGDSHSGGAGSAGCEGSLGWDPERAWTAFGGEGDRMGTACATSFTRWKEEEDGTATSGTLAPAGLGAWQPRERDNTSFPYARQKAHV